MEKIKLLIVDDSMLFIEVMTRYLKLDDSIEIVGKASDAYSARDMILQHEPDVMTLDLEMPRLDGIAFLQKLLPQYYIPSIIVSGSDARKKDGLKAGAVEFLLKPTSRVSNDMALFGAELCRLVRKAYRSNHPNSKIDPNKVPAAIQSILQVSSKNAPQAPKPPAQTAQPAQPVKPQTATQSSASIQNAAQIAAQAAAQTAAVSAAAHASQPVSEPKPNPAPPSGKRAKLKKSEAIIALGASTGGTEALENVVKYFPADTPPVIIVQHMPAGFTKLYSERLNRSCKMRVKEAQDGDRLERGLIIVGAGDFHLRLCRDGRGWYVSSKPGEKVSGHCPSVDVMFNSVADTAGPLAIGAILTGMGRDGADGLLRMRQAGAFTVGQDKATCVVYGMPMEAYNCGAVEVQAPLDKIAEIILNQLY
ncbi:MAG: chemotaxis-specific protein-glutamate methyltransferase CheB [Oscillospiraceae bacterium]|nr:chemotaxis-specific protein-glutamate methyltransferase CheB [Oscillospiraceae bacterium]